MNSYSGLLGLLSVKRVPSTGLANSRRWEGVVPVRAEFGDDAISLPGDSAGCFSFMVFTIERKGHS